MGCKTSKFDATEEILSSLNELRSLAGLQSCSAHELNNLLLLSSNPKTILHLIKLHHANAVAALEYLAQISRSIDAARRFIQTNNTQPLTPFTARILYGEQNRAAVDDAGERRRKIEKKLTFVKKSRWALWMVGGCAQTMALVSLVVLIAVGIQPPVLFALVTSIDSVQTWVDASLRGWEEELKAERVVVRAAQARWLGIMSIMESIRVLWERVSVTLEMALKDVEVKAAGISTVGMEETLRAADEQTDGLEDEVERCSIVIKAAVADFFNLVVND